MYSKEYNLTKNEAKVLEAVTYSQTIPFHIVKKSGVAHSSVYLALKNLSKRGLVAKKTKNKKTYWHKLKEPIEYDGIKIYSGISAIRNKILSIQKLPVGTKVYSYDGEITTEYWYNFLTKDETIKLNKEISKRKIIFESFLPQSFFGHESRNSDVTWKNSFLERPLLKFMLPENRDFSDAMLVIVNDITILFDKKNAMFFEIKNTEIANLLLSILNQIKQQIKKT